MVGAARRLATELVVINARATQEIHTAGGAFGRVSACSLTGATSRGAPWSVPRARRS